MKKTTEQRRSAGKLKQWGQRESGEQQKLRGQKAPEGQKKRRESPGRQMCSWILRLLYPPRCVICDRVLPVREYGCCRECGEHLPRISGPVCLKCGKPVESEELEYCEDCRKELHEFDRGAAPFTYTGKLAESVLRMKFQNRRDYIAFYAEAMEHALCGYLERWRPQLIIPAPMHPKKKRSRGYNQAELLAEELGRLTGIRCEPGLLRCVKMLPPQKELGRAERKKNLRGSFVLTKRLEGLERVLIVDDVYTTGSTIDEISRTLKAGGVQHTFFIVLCTGKGKKKVCTRKKL